MDVSQLQQHQAADSMDSAKDQGSVPAHPLPHDDSHLIVFASDTDPPGGVTEVPGASGGGEGGRGGSWRQDVVMVAGKKRAARNVLTRMEGMEPA